MPGPIDPNDPILAPIEGIDLMRYAQLSKAIGVHGLRGQDQIDEYMQRAGHTPAAWQAAYDGWNARFAANISLSTLYALMGLFSSLGKLQKQAKELERSRPPVEQQMAGALAQMQQANAFMAAQTAAAHAAADPAAVAARAQVIAVRDTGMKVNFDPTLEIDLLITVPGQPPHPVATRAIVPQGQLGRIVPGGTVAVRCNPATPQLVHFAWHAPVP